MNPGFQTLVQRTAASVLAHRTLLMILAALGFGAVAVVGARNYIGDTLAVERARLNPTREMVEIVVAKRDLRRGDPVDTDTMAVRPVPREYALSGAVSPSAFSVHVGARIQGAMRAGEPLIASNLAAPESASIATRIKPGVRAMTITVDEVSSLSGMLQPGDRIDLMLSVRPPPMAGLMQPEVTKAVLQDVLVLATGRQARASQGVDESMGPRSFTAITVEVDPDRAQRLVVAQRSGKLTAVLRNPDDRQAMPERRLDVNALLGLAVPVAAAAPISSPQIIVGGRGVMATPQPSPMPAAQGPAAEGRASAQAASVSNAASPSGTATAPGISQPGAPPARDAVDSVLPWSALEPPKSVPLIR